MCPLAGPDQLVEALSTATLSRRSVFQGPMQRTDLLFDMMFGLCASSPKVEFHLPGLFGGKGPERQSWDLWSTLYSAVSAVRVQESTLSAGTCGSTPHGGSEACV